MKKNNLWSISFISLILLTNSILVNAMQNTMQLDNPGYINMPNNRPSSLEQDILALEQKVKSLEPKSNKTKKIFGASVIAITGFAAYKIYQNWKALEKLEERNGLLSQEILQLNHARLEHSNRLSDQTIFLANSYLGLVNYVNGALVPQVNNIEKGMCKLYGHPENMGTYVPEFNIQKAKE